MLMLPVQQKCWFDVPVTERDSMSSPVIVMIHKTILLPVTERDSMSSPVIVMIHKTILLPVERSYYSG